MDVILELLKVSKSFASHAVVRNASLAIPRGSFFSLLGPSGCGKTTTLRLIAGFETPTSGEIRLNGVSINHLPPYRRSVNTVFQNYALFPHLTVRDNVGFGLRQSRASDAEERIDHVLEQVRLTGKAPSKPNELSGGERQRVALARALVLEPDVLLLDEPLSALDPLLRKQVRVELKDLQRRTGVTFLFVTHDQEEALSLSDHLAIMSAGEIEQVGTPAELYRCPRTRFVASFLGEMNWIGGIGIRPEAVAISRTCPDRGGNARCGKLKDAIFLGAHTQAGIELESGEVIHAYLRDGSIYSPGESLYVFWNPSDEVQFPA